MCIGVWNMAMDYYMSSPFGLFIFIGSKNRLLCGYYKGELAFHQLSFNELLGAEEKTEDLEKS